LIEPRPTTPASAGPASFAYGLPVRGSTTVKKASSPSGVRKPILNLPSMVSSCTWSGMSARNRIVASPRAIFDRSAYSLPVMLRLSSAKLSLPMIRNLPSVRTDDHLPLNTACEV
jgi:hypothetical protein